MVRPMMQACFGRWPFFASGIIVIILSVQWQSVHIHMWAIVGELLSRVLMIQAWDLVTVRRLNNQVMMRLRLLVERIFRLYCFTI